MEADAAARARLHRDHRGARRSVLDALGRRARTPVYGAVMCLLALNVVLVVLLFVVVDRGRSSAPRARSGSELRGSTRERRSRALRAASARAIRHSTEKSRLMAIGVKVLDRPDRRGELRARHAQGHGAHVQASVDPHKVTVQYPERSGTLSPRWRGTHRMLTTEDGKAKCVACGLCPTVCPANCIKLVPGRGRAGQSLSAGVRDRRVPLHFLRLLPGSLPGGGDPRRAATTRTRSTAATASCTISSG